ncbi:MAG: metallophosphoesterase [Bacilli bacterium]|nr:metallophosphoesterase [Bacilli bacterium]
MNIFLFILYFFLCEAAIFLVWFFLRHKKIPLFAMILWVIGELAVTILLAGVLMVYFPPIPVITQLLFALYAAVAVSMVARLIFLPIRSKIPWRKKWLLFPLLSLALGAGYLSFGIVHSQIVRPLSLIYTSEKLHHEYRIGFFSDLHVGEAKSASLSKQTILEIQKLPLDFLFIGGDMVDEYTSKQDMVETLETFRGYTVPTYWVNGNHEPLVSFSEEEISKALLDVGIHEVRDAFIPLAEDLVLLGREDLSVSSRKPESEIHNPSPDAYCVCLDHQPFAYRDNFSLGADLQLSGHTHAGQIFPLRFLYSFSVPVYGDYTEQGKTLHVSSGVGNWAVPFRTEVGCEYEVITLQPKSA